MKLRIKKVNIVIVSIISICFTISSLTLFANIDFLDDNLEKPVIRISSVIFLLCLLFLIFKEFKYYKISLITKNEKVLAHWKYDDDYWFFHPVKREKKSKRLSPTLLNIPLVIIIYYLLVTGIIFQGENLYISIGIVIIISFIYSFFGDSIKNINKIKDCIITSEGVYIGRKYNKFNEIGSGVSSVSISEGQNPSLIFNIRSNDFSSSGNFKIEVPIAEDKEENAKNIADYFNKRINSKEFEIRERENESDDDDLEIGRANV